MSDFANRLGELMQERDVDAKVLAEQLGLADSSVIYRWLKDEKGLLLPTATRLADFFDCSLDYLFGRSNNYKNGSYKECQPFYIQFRKVLSEQKVSQNNLLRNRVIGRGNLNCWLNKKQTPHIESIIKLADYLNVSMDYLVGREK